MESWWAAQNRPRGMEIRLDRISVMTPSSREMGSWRPMLLATESLRKKESPRSKRITSHSQLKNCWNAGTSRPSRARTAASSTAMPDWVMRLTMISTASPGTMRIRIKTMAQTTKMVGIRRSTRLTIYFPIVPSPSYARVTLWQATKWFPPTSWKGGSSFRHRSSA